jgi:pectin methylesterase-like acyl-CoA thioesterase
MKKLPLLLLATTLTALSAARAETVIFDDPFGSGSTLNNATPADPNTTSTAYQMLSSKNWSGQTIGANQLRIGMVATSSGIMECQALFTTNPVSLVNVNDSIQLRITFTNTAGLLSGTSQLGFGLYNSGGVNGSVKPVPGGLNSTLVNSQAGAATGYAQNWKGYFGQLFPSGSNNRIATRDAQTGASNQNQATATSGTTSSPGNPAPVNVGANVASSLTFTVGAAYTEVLTITKNGDSSLAITNILYSGPEPGGVPLATFGGIATNSTYLTGAFDSVSIGWRAAAATTMDVSKLTVTKLTQADLPALYNLQLNGFTNNTFSGAAQIGNPGDLWNNPDWVGVYSGSTNLFSGVSLVEATGLNLGVTATMTASYDNNTTDWNTGVFNHYTGQTAGSATPVLMDQVVKVDYSGSVNVMTLTFSGLPTNKLVTAYFYGAGNGSGQGGQWSLNGGPAVKIAYDGSATGRNVTLASSKGISWDILSGSTDGSGNLTITATGPSGGNPWWQTYMNGLQLQIGGTAPTILGLANVTVEDGTTVVLNPVVTGNPAPTYQWYENGTTMPGQTSQSLTLPSVTTGQSGNVYSLVAQNPIGVASNSMTLTVNASVYSTMTVTSVSPTNGAAVICYDTPLTVTFSEPVSLGSIGAIKVYDAADPGTPVDTINAASGLGQQRTFPGDGQSFTYPTITISGNTVKIAPHFNTLTSNKTYYVTIDPKTFKDSGGTNFVGLTDTNLWQFTTKPTGPADPANIVVNSDGSADFITVQGAVNSIASGNTTPTVINLRNGLYREIVDIAGKHNVTFRGQSRAGAVISFPNNATYQVANGGTTHARMNFKVNANDIVLDSLTISNSTAQGGSQAEALMIASNARRCIVNNVELASRQDTILANQNSSQAYFYKSRIKGNFDYIWGGGNLFFEQCEIRTIAGASSFNVTAARTDTSATQSASFPWANPGGTYTANGMSFVNCTFTADPGVGTVTLAGSNGTAGNNASWYGCDFATNYIAPSASLFSGNFVFWQATNTMTNSPVTFAVLINLSGADARLAAATNLVTWFYGWTPVLPPIPPSISNLTVLPDGNFGFSASGYNGQNYRVWATADVTLTPVTSTWTQISSGTFGAGAETITDLDATNHLHRFYLLTVP